ncbi:MAG: pilus assembly FimT family protein, partial [Planctomycetota bacterium]
RNLARPTNMDRSPRKPRAFTLLELVAVTALVALLGAVATLALREPLRRARLERALEQLEALDRRARCDARRWNVPVELVVRAGGSSVSYRPAGAYRSSGPIAGSGSHAGRSIALPPGLAFESHRVSARVAGDGELRVRITPLGQSPSYALGLGADGEARAWLMVLGASGQCVRLADEALVEKLLGMER